MKKDQVLKRDVNIEVFNRLAGDNEGLSSPKKNYNWLTVGWFTKGIHTESDVRNFVKVIRAALKTPKGLKPLGRVRVTKC